MTRKPYRNGRVHGGMRRSCLMLNGRDMASDPKVGDIAQRSEHPPRKVVVVFTDATGQKCLHYTETRCITVKQWARWMRDTGAYPDSRSPE